MYQQLDYSRFKTDINLTQYAAHLGYEIDRKKTTRSSIAMRKDADKIIISKRGSLWVYFSVVDDSDNGTIINFLENRTRKTIAEIGKELQGWMGESVSLPDPQNYVEDVEEQIFDPARVLRIFKRCQPARRHTYLERRGIGGQVLGSPRFAGRIHKDSYGNAVFPHYNDKGICGLELKNADKALFVRGSEKTFWRSNIRAGDNSLVLGEAVIDALSYSILFPSERAIYGATGGGVSPDQSGLVGKFLEGRAGIKKVILITDNDEGGDDLASKIRQSILGSGFEGDVIRHSPSLRGADWNNILVKTRP